MLRPSNQLWNVSIQNKGDVCQFLLIRAMKRLPQQRPLNDREKKVGLIMPTHMCMYPEYLVKICPVHSEITGLQGNC